MGLLQMEPARSAVISDDERYRYLLTRTWDEAKPVILFVMLNPSTADAYEDDPTIRRCVSFAKRDGYGGLEVTNLYAYRSTKPEELWRVFDPVGPENDYHIMRATERCAQRVAAWGANAKSARSRIVRKMLIDPCVLGLTKKGFPKHPLYISAKQPFELWSDLA